MAALRLNTKITHPEHGQPNGEAHTVDWVLYGSGWWAFHPDGRQCDDKHDYEHDGLFRKGNDGPLLDFSEVCTWLTRNGWVEAPDVPAPSQVRVTSIKYARGEAIQVGVVEHKSKCGRVKIIADSRDDTEPTIYRAWVLDGSAMRQIEPPPKPRQRKFYDGWWRLKDAREAALAAVNGDVLPFSGTKPRVMKYDTYDPEKEGYGSEEQWRATFDARIDRNEADKILGGESPESILYLVPGATQAQIKKAYRRLIGKWHPDKHGNSKAATEKATKIKAAYDLLRE